MRARLGNPRGATQFCSPQGLRLRNEMTACSAWAAAWIRSLRSSRTWEIPNLDRPSFRTHSDAPRTTSVFKGANEMTFDEQYGMEVAKNKLVPSCDQRNSGWNRCSSARSDEQRGIGTVSGPREVSVLFSTTADRP
jgi:hypothetical protein